MGTAPYSSVPRSAASGACAARRETISERRSSKGPSPSETKTRAGTEGSEGWPLCTLHATTECIPYSSAVRVISPGPERSCSSTSTAPFMRRAWQVTPLVAVTVTVAVFPDADTAEIPGAATTNAPDDHAPMSGWYASNATPFTPVTTPEPWPAFRQGLAVPRLKSSAPGSVRSGSVKMSPAASTWLRAVNSAWVFVATSTLAKSVYP